MESVHLDRLEVDPRQLDVLDPQRMLVRGPQIRGHPAVEVDQEVVAERLHEDGDAVWLEGSGYLGVRALEVQVVEDGVATDDVERLVGEGQRLAIHDPEFDRDLPRAGDRLRLLHGGLGEIDPGDPGAIAGQLQAVIPAPTAIFEDAAPGCLAAQEIIPESDADVGDRVILVDSLRVSDLAILLVVEGLLAGFSSVDQAHSGELCPPWWGRVRMEGSRRCRARRKRRIHSSDRSRRTASAACSVASRNPRRVLQNRAARRERTATTRIVTRSPLAQSNL